MMKEALRNGLIGLITGVSVMGNLGLDVYVGNSQTRNVVYGQEGEETELKILKYHPVIKDFERELERTVSPLVPAYFECFSGVILYPSESLKEKVLKIRENPKIVQNNKYYKEFEKHLKYHYDNPDEKGFLGTKISLTGPLSLSDLLGTGDTSNINVLISPDIRKKIQESYGFDVNFKNPSKADKSSFFLYWLWEKKRERLRISNKGIMFKVLDEINKSGIMTTEDYKNEEYIDFSLFDGCNIIYKKNLKGLKDESKTILASEQLKEEQISFIPRNTKITLGLYLPERDNIKKGRVELYNPKGERSLKSSFDINSEEHKGVINMENISDKYGPGTYAAVYFIDDKCWEARQFEVLNMRYKWEDIEIDTTKSKEFRIEIDLKNLEKKK